MSTGTPPPALLAAHARGRRNRDDRSRSRLESLLLAAIVTVWLLDRAVQTDPSRLKAQNLIIRILDNEPVTVAVEGTSYRVMSVGIDEARCYIGASDGNIVVQLSAFFSNKATQSTAWHHGFKVLNEIVAEKIAAALVNEGKAQRGSV